MSVIPEILERLQRLEDRVEMLIMPATVLAVHADTNLLDVSIYEDLELHNVPYLTQRAGTNGQTYWVPEVGEAGMLLCPSGDVANARFMAAFNTTTVPAPETDPAVMLRIFKTDRQEKYDGNDDEHVLTIDQSTRTTKPMKLRTRPAPPVLRSKPPPRLLNRQKPPSKPPRARR